MSKRICSYRSQSLEEFTTSFQILKATINQPKFRPESIVLSVVAIRLWKKISNPLFAEITKSFSFDNKGSVDRSKQKKIKDMADKAVKEFSKQIKPKAEKIFKKIQVNAVKHFSAQIKNPPKPVKPRTFPKTKAEEDDGLSEFEEFLLAIGLLQLISFIEEYPERLLLPNLERINVLFELPPSVREVNFTKLSQRVLNFQAKTQVYLAQLTDVFAARQWHFTGLKLMHLNKVAQFQIIAQMDKVTCPVCQRLHGRIFSVVKAIKKMEEFLALKDPDKMSEFYKFPRVNRKAWRAWIEAQKAVIDDIDNKTQAQIEKLNLMVPFHGRCRCEIVAL